MVWPMVPAGVSNDLITMRDITPVWDRREDDADDVNIPDEDEAVEASAMMALPQPTPRRRRSSSDDDEPPHPVRARREQVGCARAHLRADLATRVQHPLLAGETEDPHVSRMTVTVDADDVALEQVVKQLNKSLRCRGAQGRRTRPRERHRTSVLFKVKADAATRSQIIDLVTMFRANIIDVDHPSRRWSTEKDGTSRSSRRCSRRFEPFGIRELVQSGVVGLGRGSKAISARDKKKN